MRGVVQAKRHFAGSVLMLSSVSAADAAGQRTAASCWHACIIRVREAQALHLTHPRVSCAALVVFRIACGRSTLYCVVLACRAQLACFAWGWVGIWLVSPSVTPHTRFGEGGWRSSCGCEDRQALLLHAQCHGNTQCMLYACFATQHAVVLRWCAVVGCA